jgi:hypothetical protein
VDVLGEQVPQQILLFQTGQEVLLLQRNAVKLQMSARGKGEHDNDDDESTVFLDIRADS